MLREIVAIHSIPLPGAGAPPEWVHLLPFGTFHGRDGRGPYRMPDRRAAQAVVAATVQYQAGADLPIDYDHQIYRSEHNGRPALAAGWISVAGLEVREDGIWGRVEWTSKAAQHLKEREYRYLSPAIVHDQAGNVLRLDGAGLVNNPNLELTALASKLPGGAVNLDEFLKRLAGVFGLAETATAEAVSAHAKCLVDGMTAVATALGLSGEARPEQLATHAKGLVEKAAAIASVSEALGAPGDSTPEQLVVHAKQLKTAAPDPGQYVSLSVHNALAGKLEALERERAGEKAQAAVAKAKAEGKLIPAQEAWGLALASKDLAEFETWANGAPVVVQPGAVVPVGQPQGESDAPDQLAGRITSYMSKQRAAGREISYAQALSEIKKGGAE